MGTSSQTIGAPGVTRVHSNSVGDVIQAHREAIGARRYEPIGKMLNILLGPDDEAAYMQKKDVRERIARLSQYRGLQLDWGNDGPIIAYAPHRSSCLFPFGISKPPRAYDPVPMAKHGSKIKQELEDYASGYMMGRDGTTFMILRPVMYIGVWIMASLYTMVGRADRQGDYPTLLINPKTREGHIVGGSIILTTAHPTGMESMPWEGAKR